MGAFGLLLLLAGFLGALAQTDITQRMGYDNSFSCGYQGGYFSFSLTITDNDCANAKCSSNTSFWVKISSQDNPTIKGANIQIYLTQSMPSDPMNPPQNAKFLTKNNNVQETYGEVQVNTSGIYYIWGICNCQQCQQSGNAYGYLSALVLWQNEAQAFPVIQNPYTTNYTADPTWQNTYGWPGTFTLTAQASVYVILYAYNTATQVVMVFQEGTAPKTTDPLPAVSTATVVRYPAQSQTLLGTYASQGISLGAGTWYVAPYVVALPNKAPYDFKFAFAIGQPPTGAAVAVRAPLSLVGCLAALCGLWALW